jgi:PAS domain S-box-containing protein
MDTGTRKTIPHILILEDDAAHRDLILRAFRDDPDKFRMSIAGTIRSAREILERDLPDLILSDWILPDGKGLDILPRTEGLVTIPLIIMTSFGDERLAVEIMKSGAIDYVVKSATMFRDLPHIARRALSDWENIQERKRAEAAVQDTQKRIADIMNFLPDAVLAIDNEGKVIGWNHAIERMTGVMAADMLGKGDHEHSIPFYGVRRPILIDLVLMDDQEIEKKYDYVQRNDGRITSETYIPTLFGGKGAYLWGTATPLYDSAGNRIGAIEVIRDITDRKQAEEILQKREAILETLLNAPNDTIALLDRQGIFIGSNTVGAQRLGSTIQEIIGKCAYDLLPPDVAKARKEKIDRVFETGETARFDDFRAGMYLHNEIFPIFNPEHSAVDQVAIFARDITEQKKADLALQESEGKYRFLIDNVRDIVWQTSPDLTFTYASTAAETLTGYLPDDLIGTSLFAILTEPSARVVRERLRERMEDYSHGNRDLATVFEAEIRKKDGSLLWLEVSSNAVFGPDGTIVGFQGISRDITERKRAEKALLESEVRFRDLFNNMSAGVAIYEQTPDGKDFIIRGVNHAVETIEQVKKDEIVGKSVLKVFPGVVEFGLFAVFQRVAKTGIAESHPISMYRDNRVSGWRENYVYKLLSGEIVAIYEDVTEKKQAEEKLRESEEKYHGLFDSMRDAFASVDMSGRITLFNEPFQKMVGYEKEEIYNLSYDDLTPEKWRAIEADIIKNQVLTQGYSGIYEKEYRRKDGTVFPVELRTFLVRDDAGNPHNLSAIVRDITERKRVEEELQATEHQLSTIYRNIYEILFFLSVEQNDRYRFLSVNQPFMDITGLTREQVIGRYVDEVIPEPSLTLVLGKYKQAILENTTLTWDEITEYPSGTKWGEVRVTPLFDATGHCTNLVGSVHDITERKLADQKLRESEERYRSVIENAAEGITVAQDGTLQYANSRLLDMIQTDPTGIAGRLFTDFIHPDDRASVFDRFQRRVSGEKVPQHYDFRVVGTRGKVTWVQISAVRIEWNGRPATLNFLMDITDRKQAEEKLRESEERYRALLFGSGIGVGYWSTDGTLLFLNDISLKRLRGTEADFIGKNMHELFREEADMYLDRIQKAVLSPDPVEYEDYVSLPAGKGWYLSVYTRICRPDGSVMGIQVLSMDITERRQAEEIRKAYESRLDSAMEIGSLAWWEMDLPDGAVRFDDRKATMLGYTSGQFTHYTDFTAILHPDDFEPAMQAMKDHLDDRQSRYHIDYRIRTAAGDYRWFRDVGGITRHHSDGSPATVTGIVIDITANKQAEEALRATEIRYRALFQNSSDIIRILDRNGLIVYESESSERILGYPRGYLIGKNPLEYIHPEDLEHVKNDFQEVLDRTNTGTPTEFRIRKADGEYIWVDSIGTNLLEVPGVNGVVITTRPIQQRKEAERALRKNEARLATAMDIAGLVNWEFDVATGMFTFDDRFYSLYATTADREGGNLMLAETYMQEFVYPDDRPKVLSEIQKLLATTDPMYSGQMEHRITPRDGSVRTIIARYAPVVGPDGKVIRTYGANQDITDFKLMESEIRSLNSVLEQRVRDRTEALAKTNMALEEEVAQRQEAEKKLQTSFNEKVMLLKEIHHRVKNNLQIIASLLNLQSRYITDQKTLAAIRESQNRVKAMALVHEKLYRSEDIAHISLHDYIRFLGTGLFQFYDAKLRGIQFTLDIHDVNVDIDTAIPLGLTINELISNSLKYAFPEGRKGEISISVRKEGHDLMVLYWDNGIGIPAELDWKNTQSLGLRLVNTLVDQLNGTIELDRSAGTQFTIVLHEKEQKGPS